MSFWLLGGVTLVYVWIAVEGAIRGPHWQAVVFGGYALANCGLLWAMRMK
jgi:hypothetical protein